MLVVVADGVRDGLDGKVGVPHRHAAARRADQAEVVRAVAEGERLFDRDPQRGAERAQRVALVGRGDVQLDVRGHRGADRDLGEERGQSLELFFPRAHVAEVHLGLLHAAAVGAEIGLQVLHRRARAVEQLKDAAVGDVVPGPLVHRPRDIAPVVLVAVVDHVERVHVLHQAQRQLVRHLRAAERFVPLRVEDLRPVDRDVIARKGLEPQRGGHALVDAPRRRDDQRAPFVRRVQRPQAAIGDRLVVMQDRAVEVEGDQLVLHASSHGSPFS